MALELSHHFVDFDFAIHVHVARYRDCRKLLSVFYNNKFHKGKRYTGTCKRVFSFVIMKARQFLDRKKSCFDSMYVIGYHDVGAGRLLNIMFRGQSQGFFKRCFLKTNCCTKYSYKKRQNSTDVCSKATKFRTTAEQ